MRGPVLAAAVTVDANHNADDSLVIGPGSSGSKRLGWHLCLVLRRPAMGWHTLASGLGLPWAETGSRPGPGKIFFFFGGGGLTFTHIWRLAIGESVPGPATSNFNFKVSRLVIKSYPLGDG